MLLQRLALWIGVTCAVLLAEAPVPERVGFLVRFRERADEK
jgi:hypothetical protein